MADLTVNDAAETGGISFEAAAAGGDAIPGNTGKILLVVDNGGAGAVAVTVTAQDTSKSVPLYGTMSKADGGGSVAAGAVDVFGPFPVEAFNDAAGKVQITYDQVDTVNVAAVKV